MDTIEWTTKKIIIVIILILFPVAFIWGFFEADIYGAVIACTLLFMVLMAAFLVYMELCRPKKKELNPIEEGIKREAYLKKMAELEAEEDMKRRRRW